MVGVWLGEGLRRAIDITGSGTLPYPMSPTKALPLDERGTSVLDGAYLMNQGDRCMGRFDRSLMAVALGAFVALGAMNPAAAQDVAAGEKYFARCQACHNIDEPKNKVGPHLVGLFGRTAGTVEGYNYSPANKNSGVTWNAETLDPYLTDPRGYIKGTKMAFAGIKDATDRANVIAYLEQASKPK